MSKILIALVVGLLSMGPVAAKAQSINALASSTKGAQWTFFARGCDMHTATGDVCSITIPAAITVWRPQAVMYTNCTAVTPTFTQGMFTGAGGTGTTVQTVNAFSSANANTGVAGGAGAATTVRASAANTVFVRVTVVDTAVDACDVGLNLQDISP